MRYLLAIVALLATPGAHAADRELTAAAITKMMATGDGLSPETAYKVKDVADEYAIMRELGLQVTLQSLVIKKRPYDVLTGKGPDGVERKIWFDISKFYGRGF